MKRNLETIRDILIRLESYNDKELTDRELIYHMDLLMDKHITGARLQDGSSVYLTQLNLTEEGYDILTHISNKTVWDSIKENLAENDMTVNDVPIDIIKWLSQKTMKDMFGGNDNGFRN